MLPYQIFNTASKGTPPFTLLLSKCQGFGAPQLLLYQARVSSTAGQHHLVNNSLLQLGVLVCAPPPPCVSVRGPDRPESPSHRRPFRQSFCTTHLHRQGICLVHALLYGQTRIKGCPLGSTPGPLPERPRACGQTRAPFLLDLQQVMFFSLCPTKSSPPIPLLPAKPGKTSFLNLRLQQRQQ